MSWFSCVFSMTSSILSAWVPKMHFAAGPVVCFFWGGRFFCKKNWGATSIPTSHHQVRAGTLGQQDLLRCNTWAIQDHCGMWWLVTSSGRDRGSHRGSWTFTTVPWALSWDCLGGGNSKIFWIFTPNLGEMIIFDLPIIFQMGWFKHQLESDTACSFKLGQQNPRFAVHPDWAGKGLGKRLFEACQMQAMDVKVWSAGWFGKEFFLCHDY